MIKIAKNEMHFDQQFFKSQLSVFTNEGNEVLDKESSNRN